MKRWQFWILIFVSFVAQMTIVVLSGSHYCNGEICGLFFWGAHEHDGIWHLALANSGLATFPARFPTYAGAFLAGYNVLLDYLLRIFSSLTTISANTIYFKIIPVIWFGLMIMVWKKFASIYDKRYSFLISLLFFIFWGNSFSYWLRLYNQQTIWGGSGLLAMQSPQMLTNIQFALTLPLLGALLILMMRKFQTWKSALEMGTIIFMIMGLKFYGGVVGAVMIAGYGLCLLLEKRYREFGRVTLLTIIGSLSAIWLFYDPLNSLSGSSILAWKPLATMHPIIEDGGLLHLLEIANLRNNLWAVGVSWRLIAIEVATLGIFIFFNWGTRLIAVVRGRLNQIDWVILGGVVCGLLMNLLFVQRGEWWNTVQFLYYAIFLSGIWAAKVLADWWDKRILGKLSVIVVVLLTIPNGIDTLRVFSSFPPHSYVPDKELEALDYLKKQPDGVVLALPIDPIPGHDRELPRPLFNKYDTAYVAAFTGKQTYLNDLVQLRLTGIDYQERLRKVQQKNCQVLEQVKYIYISGDYSPMMGWQKCQNYRLQNIYEGGETSIYSVIAETPNQY